MVGVLDDLSDLVGVVPDRLLRREAPPLGPLEALGHGAGEPSAARRRRTRRARRRSPPRWGSGGRRWPGSPRPAGRYGHAFAERQDQVGRPRSSAKRLVARLDERLPGTGPVVVPDARSPFDVGAERSVNTRQSSAPDHCVRSTEPFGCPRRHLLPGDTLTATRRRRSSTGTGGCRWGRRWRPTGREPAPRGGRHPGRPQRTSQGERRLDLDHRRVGAVLGGRGRRRRHPGLSRAPPRDPSAAPFDRACPHCRQRGRGRREASWGRFPPHDRSAPPRSGSRLERRCGSGTRPARVVPCPRAPGRGFSARFAHLPPS